MLLGAAEGDKDFLDNDGVKFERRELEFMQMVTPPE